MTWVNMLRSINGVSEAAANKLGASYKNATQLITALNDSSKTVAQRLILLQDSMTKPSAKSNKTVSKLTRKIFRIFTSTDNDATVNSDDDGDGNDETALCGDKNKKKKTRAGGTS
jgi:molybdenum-dependent DNA-binding transcriptional regulator ModE